MPVIQSGVWDWVVGSLAPGGLAEAEATGDCASNPMTCTSWWYGNINDSQSWGFGYDGFSHLSLAAKDGTLSFQFPHIGLRLDGVQTDPQELPPGFTVAGAYHFEIYLTGSNGFVGDFEYQPLGINEDLTDFSSLHIYDYDGLDVVGLLSIEGFPFRIHMTEVAYPGGSGGGNIRLGGGGVNLPRFYGTYLIIQWWWKLPDVTNCGERNTNNPDDSKSHLVLSGDQPPTPEGAFGEFEKLDPNDPDAAPTPFILNVVPNHGRGGTRVEIYGEGFGDDANVQFDGVDALDIEVVSQYKIRATAPPHANGYANIAVINPDGVST